MEDINYIRHRDLDPFQIHQSGSGVYVAAQTSTISQNLDLESYCKIRDLDKPFFIKPEQVIYLAMDIAPDLSVISGQARLICSYVGINLIEKNNWLTICRNEVTREYYLFQDTSLYKPYLLKPSDGASDNAVPTDIQWNYRTDAWLEYPSPYRIYPRDKEDANGKIIQRTRGKKQTKLFIMVGYAGEINREPWSIALVKPEFKDIPWKSGNPLTYTYNMERKFYVVQSLKQNITLINGCIGGVPMTFPIPSLITYPPMYTYSEA
jgi:hypothetical protein